MVISLFTPGRKDTIKACIYVKELVRFMLYRLEHHEHGVELYNCCFEPAYTIQHIVEAMKKVTGLTQFVPDILTGLSCLWQELPCFLAHQWVSVLRE